MPDSQSSSDAAAYVRLETRFRRLNALGEAQEVLHWDMSTVMPRGGHESRAEQLAELAAVYHGMLTDSETGDLIAAAEADTAALTDWQQANLREIKRNYVKATALSEDLVTRLSRASSACEAVWRDARADNDFKAVQPLVTELLKLVREKAAAKASVLGVGLYDALLADYEPGGRSAEVDTVFDELEGFLPGFLGEVLEHQAKAPKVILPDGPFPEEKQKALGQRFMEMLGFDFHHGRLDVSLHPFCGGTPDDVRITTRYDESDFTSALMGVLHETGHAMYERGLPKDWRGQPVGHALGMSVHESQSLLIEMQVCRSKTFLNFATPIMVDTFGGTGPAWDADNLFRLYTQVERSCIRVDADRGRHGNPRPARRLERRHGAAFGHPPADGHSRLPTRHPLVRRGLGLFPDLYPGRHDGGAALCRRPRTGHIHRACHRPRRLRAADDLAARQRARQGVIGQRERAAHQRHGQAARPEGV
jgi:carboxypeptidase Taq